MYANIGDENSFKSIHADIIAVNSSMAIIVTHLEVLYQWINFLLSPFLMEGFGLRHRVRSSSI